MITLISKGQLANGGFENVWMLTLFHDTPSTYFVTIRNASESEVNIEARNERAQIMVSAIGKYLSIEQTNGLSKDVLEEEAIDRLTKMYEYMMSRRLDIEGHCKNILAMEKMIMRIGRPGTQYVYALILIKMAKDQQEYEKSIQSIT